MNKDNSLDRLYINRIIENIDSNNLKNNMKLFTSYTNPQEVLIKTLLIYQDLNAKNFEKNFIPLIDKFGLDLSKKENLIILAMKYKVDKLIDITVKQVENSGQSFNFNIIKTKYLECLSKYSHISVDVFLKTKTIFNFKNDDLKVMDEIYNIKSPKICKKIYEQDLKFITFVKNADFQVRKIKNLEDNSVSVNKRELDELLEHLSALVQTYLKKDPSKEIVDTVVQYFTTKGRGNNERYDILTTMIEYNVTKDILNSQTIEEKPKIKKLKI